MSENELAQEAIGEQPPIPSGDEQPPAPADEPPGETPVDEPPDPAAVKAEIEALEARRKKAEEDAKYWRQEKAKARADYFRDRQKPDQPPAASEPETLKPPDPNDFDDYNDFVKAQTDFTVEAKKRQWDKEQADQADNKAYQDKMITLQEKIDQGYEKYDDFEEIALDNTVPITPTVMDILAESEMPADVAYYLGKNRTTAISISKMTPVAAARAIAKIETEIAASPPDPPPKKTTSAPPPIKPVGSGSAAITKDPSKMTQAEYEAWRNEQGARRF